ncbi:hypothetical protein FOZ63_011321, partial [Perkinsus olseni]
DFMTDIAEYWGVTKLIICTDSEIHPLVANSDGLSQRLTYISQLVALLEDPGIYSLENLPAFYVVPGDNEPIPIPSKITTKPTKIAINNTIIDDDGGDEITGYDTDNIAALLYRQRRLALAFQEWQESSLNLEDPDHEQPPILSSLVRVIRSAQYRFGRQRLLRAPFTSIDDDLVIRHCRQDTNGLVHTQ